MSDVKPHPARHASAKSTQRAASQATAQRHTQEPHFFARGQQVQGIWHPQGRARPRSPLRDSRGRRQRRPKTRRASADTRTPICPLLLTQHAHTHCARHTHCTPQLHCTALHAGLCVRFPLRPAPPAPLSVARRRALITARLRHLPRLQARGSGTRITRVLSSALLRPHPCMKSFRGRRCDFAS
jgi:hypothetical protein